MHSGSQEVHLCTLHPYPFSMWDILRVTRLSLLERGLGHTSRLFSDVNPC